VLEAYFFLKIVLSNFTQFYFSIT